MSGFNNSIVGGQGVLIRPSVHSPGYIPETTGWSINEDGTADFNDVHLHGSIFIDSSVDGIFIYAT